MGRIRAHARAVIAALGRFRADRSGVVSLETLMIVGLISLPIVFFLINYADFTATWVGDRTPVIFNEADQLISGN